MGHRLTKIYTRTGDDGSTGLADGSRLNKTDARVEAMGDVDELNCVIGLLIAQRSDLQGPSSQATLSQTSSSQTSSSQTKFLSWIQHTLFDLGAELSIPGAHRIKPEDVVTIENELDTLNAPLAPLKEFILPGGSQSIATCHLARAVCRRAERRLITTHQSSPLNHESLAWINRLSDYLFVLARAIAHTDNTPEVYWKPAKK